MEPLDLFKGEPDESIEKINQTVHSLEAYYSAYLHYKNNLKNYFKNGEVVKEFDFSPKLVFARWEKFMERVRIIQDLFQTAAEFLRLEKVEIGGLTRKINANDYDIYFIIYVFLTFFFLNYRSERENA